MTTPLLPKDAAASDASSNPSSKSSSGDNSYPSTSSATEATHSSTSSPSASSTSNSREGSSASRSGSSRSSSATSSSSSSGSGSGASGASSHSRSRERRNTGTSDATPAVPRKVPRTESAHGTATTAASSACQSINERRQLPPPGSGRAPIREGLAPTAPSPDYAGVGLAPPPATPPPPPVRYGPIFAYPMQDAWAAPLPPPPPAPPMPTLSASAKDISEMDVRAGLRLGVYRATTRLNKEQVMDEIESVRLTSQVERVLFETAQSLTLPGVPIEEREYAWTTVFFANAEVAELCAARMCQPGRRSKWARVSLQRLPVVSLLTHPLSAAEEERWRVHVYQMVSAVSSSSVTSADVAVTPPPVADTLLARSASGWCALSTGGLLPTMGLASYMKHRRNGEFAGVDVCARFDTIPEKDSCPFGGQCKALHLRELEQWKLLLPVVLPVKNASTTAASHDASSASLPMPAETPWQQQRHADSLVVQPLPADIDEEAFVYMFRGCGGFVRAQTVRTANQVRYGVVQFADGTSAQVARQQATENTDLSVRWYGDLIKAAQAAENGVKGETGSKGSSRADSAVPPSPRISGVTPAETAEALATYVDSTAPSTSAMTAVPLEAHTTAPTVTHVPDVPFPPLPEGWAYGLSRRTMQYFFLQSGKKSTTWKHPVTQEQYKARR